MPKILEIKPWILTASYEGLALDCSQHYEIWASGENAEEIEAKLLPEDFAELIQDLWDSYSYLLDFDQDDEDSWDDAYEDFAQSVVIYIREAKEDELNQYTIFIDERES